MAIVCRLVVGGNAFPLSELLPSLSGKSTCPRYCIFTLSKCTNVIFISPLSAFTNRYSARLSSTQRLSRSRTNRWFQTVERKDKNAKFTTVAATSKLGKYIRFKKAGSVTK